VIYSTLQGRVAEYLDRTDLTTQIQNWINDTRKSIAVEALAQNHMFDYLYTEATMTTSAGSGVYALPSDYLGHLTIMLANKKLHRVGAREFDDLHVEAYENVDDDGVLLTTTNSVNLSTTVSNNLDPGEPDYYIDRGMAIELFPVPDMEYTVTIKYYALPTDFSLDADEDYMCRFHPEAVIFGASLRGAVFMDDTVKIPVFESKFDKEMKKILYKEKQKEVTDLPIRMKSWKDFDALGFKRKMRLVT
jgi:hypothetical protein